MKKLFSTMLAATMVAGMSVSAFAELKNGNTPAWTTDTFGKNDYAVIGAYDSDGKLLDPSSKTNKLDSGDKIYFPILISGDEMDDDRTADKDVMFFADKASEVKNLKASVKDEIGGKYIDSAAIVKKDIKIDNAGVGITAGTKQSFTVDLKGLVLNGTPGKYELTVGGQKVDVDVTANDTTATKVATLFDGKTATIGGVAFTAKASGEKVIFTANKAAENQTISAASEAATTAGITTPTTSLAYANVVAGVASTGVEENKLSKIYCVEVKMSDYYKNEETEVEFNIQLKNSGKTEYNTDDDHFKFNGTFDLGKDSAILTAGVAQKNSKGDTMVKATKFKKGDLEIEIGKNTRSVQLDEAYLSDGTTKEDITNIYIENDKTIDNAFTFDVKASSQDDLYLELNQDAIKDLAVSNSKADLTFFNFPGKPEFDFTGLATFAVEDDDEDNYFYEVVDGELVESRAKYNKEDGTFELRTNKLGSYVISDKELKVSEGKKEDDAETKPGEPTGGDATADATTGANGEKGNANTGAADLIGVASALAVVSIAAAGAVALKK